MASPLRFRVSHEGWGQGRFEREILRPLDDKFGASAESTDDPDGYEGRVLRMRNGDVALFAWRPNGSNAYWTGNTETPKALWRTEKRAFEEVGGELADWAQSRLMELLLSEASWLGRYESLARFFLPVLMSKDGSETAREFLRTGAGLPGVDADMALSFYDRIVASGVFEGYRYTMASKLGTSEGGDRVRMEATMAEFNAAAVLHDAGYSVEPEIEVETGHSLDFRASDEDGSFIVEVTRPTPTGRRNADTPERAVRETAGKKTEAGAQLRGNDAVLFVDCSSFDDGAWRRIVDEKPGAGHEPAVFYRTRPDTVEAFLKGETRLRLTDAVDWV
ncbi:DUF5784 family protein [Haladaptatus sp. F3-133]|jgi:hypothetical protein|uniref:DUF5784 family protein n=1 Tax=Halorutilus salinus TaxID=2487751 RepID=A0A9Q4C4F4_9EURY|nr:DUF5784 family protein [Halorutilus salinus]MCX2818936.1 DUF5784 family protein [Halorutilus salinus]